MGDRRPPDGSGPICDTCKGHGRIPGDCHPCEVCGTCNGTGYPQSWAAQEIDRLDAEVARLRALGYCPDDCRHLAASGAPDAAPPDPEFAAMLDRAFLVLTHEYCGEAIEIPASSGFLAERLRVISAWGALRREAHVHEEKRTAAMPALRLVHASLAAAEARAEAAEREVERFRRDKCDGCGITITRIDGDGQVLCVDCIPEVKALRADVARERAVREAAEQERKERNYVKGGAA